VISDQLYRLKTQKITLDFLDKIKNLDSSLKTQIGDDFLYMLFRIGYCEIQPIRSKRRQISLSENKV
jgi:hypothetical protein